MYLRTMGTLRLESPDPDKANAKNVKPLLLLAYLALEGPQVRRRLATLFWPFSKNSLNSLARAIKQLRELDPATVQTEEHRVWTALPCDATELLGALGAKDYEKALQLHQAPFLQDLYVRDCGVELEEWIDETRDALARQVALGQLRLAEAEAAKGNFEGAAEKAEDAYLLSRATLEPETLGRIHTLLLAGNRPGVPALLKEAAEFGLDLLSTQAEARDLLSRSLRWQRPKHNLPKRDTSFVGRDLELADVLVFLAEHRLVTLLGQGGVGKSRLALEVATQPLCEAQFPDGTFFVSLEVVASAAALPVSIAEALGLDVRERKDPLAQLKQGIGERAILLLLDNFEHLIEAAEQLADLLAYCSKLSVLTTSRERLQLEEEWIYELGGLVYPHDERPGLDEARHFDAVRLFTERATQASPAFSLSEANLDAVLEICRRVDGVPLALELAAPWVRVMSCAELSRELERNLDILTTATRNVADRHKSIRASFEHSYTRLTPEEQTVFSSFGVFRGGFWRDAASKVAGAAWSVIASLVDKSLLRVADGRYAMHPLIAEFCQEKLALREDELQLQRRHAEYFLELASTSEGNVEGDPKTAWLNKLAPEHKNIVAALAFAQQHAPELGLALAVALEDYWIIRGYYQLGLDWLSPLLAAAHKSDLDVETKALRASAIYVAGKLKSLQGDYERARALLQESLGLTEQASDRALLAKLFDALGYLDYYQGHYPGARSFFERGRDIYVSIGDQRGTAVALNNLGNAAFKQNQVTEARTLYEESLRLREQLGDQRGLADARHNLGNIAYLQGHQAKAQQLFKESLDLKRQFGDQRGIAESLINLGVVYMHQGEFGEAKAFFQEGLILQRQLGNHYGLAMSLQGVAVVARHQGNFAEAKAFFKEALALEQQFGNRNGIGDGLADIGLLFGKLEQFDVSVTLFAASQALLKSAGAELEPETLKQMRESLARAREHLGAKQFQHRFEKGKELSQDAAVAFAFAQLDTVAS